ncbi:MAG: AIPR family protein [Bacteroidales bacterium]|nr:AIPR family protein [Bacteroidales bacterium]
MINTLEHSELQKFYHSLIQDLKSLQLSEDDGGNLEQIFTRTALDLLTDAGETENARDAYDEGQLGTKKQHKINAYAEPDNYETADLFITIFKGTDEPQRIPKDEIDTAVKRIANFFRKAKYKEYVNEIEESSPIFDFAHTLANSEALKENLVRVNAIILTDGIYPGENPESQTISGIPIFYRVVDVNYLYNITEKSHIPIGIDFKKEGFEVPCIISPSENDQYQSYLAIIPGTALATIYERYGSRLLEQNVRSFLQFTGKINKGIRNTIMKEPQMFLAFNNGIAATAEELEIDESEDGKGLLISKVKDFQIVNGGQTTASIYHTLKKDKADISDIFVQVKLSVVKNRSNFSEIVSRISEYANTQNKVSVSDLSSNRPYHIELEKLSRNIFAPHVAGQTSQQTKWFYERARGQYKNARVKEGFTKAKQKAFDLKNPKNQMLTKEDLAKYANAYREEVEGKKIVVGPHWVVKGNQKNYAQFIGFNLEKKIDSIYYEDIIAKAILFRTAEKLYGVKPNSIGDMRYLTVPYTISFFGYLTDYKLDLYKIWKNQGLSESLKKILYGLMKEVEHFIKTKAPGALYGEWAKKEECWNELKKQKIDIDFNSIKADFEDPKNPSQRKRLADEETAQVQIQEDIDTINTVPPAVWHKIEDWGRTTEKLSEQQKTVAFNLAGRVRNNTRISDYERASGINILDIVNEKAPELLEEIDELNAKNKNKPDNKEITLELIKKIVLWDRKNRRLKDVEYKFMAELAEGRKILSEHNKKIASWNLEKVKKNGFIE